MTAEANDLKVGPVTPANGVTTIQLDFYVEDETQLEVQKNATTLALGVGYTFAGEGTSTGVVTLLTAANGTDAYTVKLVPTLERVSDFGFRADLRSDSLNLELDRLWRALQYLSTQISGETFLFTPDSDQPAALQTVSAAGRIGKVLGFTADGEGLALQVAADNIGVPGSSTDNAIVRWDGATGAAIQSSGVTISDANVLDLSSSTSHLALAAGTTGERPGTPAAGMFRYNSTIGAIETYVSGAWKGLVATEDHASIATGDIFYASAANRVRRLAAGTQGQVLTMGASVPAWGGTAPVLLSAQDAAGNASLDFNQYDATRFRRYFFEIEGLVPSVDGAILWMRTSADAGSSYDSGASNYGWKYIYNIAGTFAAGNSDGDTKIILHHGVGNGAGESLDMTVHMRAPDAARNTIVDWKGGYLFTDGRIVTVTGAGQRISAAAVDGAQFLFSSGNITSGRISLYGVPGG